MDEQHSFDRYARELDHRAADGIEVTLLWSEQTRRLAVAVYDARTDERFELTVERCQSPLEVFNHPFAYAASRGIEYRAGLREPAEPVHA